MKLRIEENETGYTVFLDEKALQDVKEYEVKKDSTSPKKAVLSLTMLVDCTIE